MDKLKLHKRAANAEYAARFPKRSRRARTADRRRRIEQRERSWLNEYNRHLERLGLPLIGGQERELPARRRNRRRARRPLARLEDN